MTGAPVVLPRPVVLAVVLALFAALLGDLLLGGILIGHAAKPLPSPPEIVSFGPILKSLPEADRHLMHRAFTEHRKDIQLAADAARQSAATVQQALATNPFDAGQLERAVATYHHDFLALRALMQDVFWQGAEQLSPEGRKRLAESAAFKKLTVGGG